jgi:hypothetical protein
MEEDEPDEGLWTVFEMLHFGTFDQQRASRSSTRFSSSRRTLTGSSSHWRPAWISDGRAIWR